MSTPIIALLRGLPFHFNSAHALEPEVCVLISYHRIAIGLSQPEWKLTQPDGASSAPAAHIGTQACVCMSCLG